MCLKKIDTCEVISRLDFFKQKAQSKQPDCITDELILVDHIISADKIDLSSEPDAQRDYKFVKWLSKNRKLQGIPPSAFFSEEHKFIGENYIRFCFIKVNLEKGNQPRII